MYGIKDCLPTKTSATNLSTRPLVYSSTCILVNLYLWENKKIWSYDVRDIITPYYVLFMCGYFFLSARHMQYAPSSTRGTESNWPILSSISASKASWSSLVSSMKMRAVKI